MAVAFQSNGAVVSTGVTGTSGTSTNLTIGAGTNLCLIAALTFEPNTGGPGAFTKANWDDTGTPQALTLITNASESDNFCSVYFFGLVNPNLGANTLAFSWTNTQRWSLAGISFTGVDQTGGATSFKNATSYTGNANNPQPISVSSPTNDMALALFAGAGTITLLGTASVGTQIYSDNSHVAVAAVYNAGVGTTILSEAVTGGTGTPMVAIGFDIAAALPPAPLIAQIWI